MLLLILLLSAVTLGHADNASDLKLVCYYSNWAVYRPGLAKFTPENINPHLCTHLIYAFASLSEDFQLQPFDPYNDIEQGNYRNFVNLKSFNPNLKTLVAVGGWNEGSRRFSRLVASDHNRQIFVNSVIRFLREFHFDGLDLDWEYPAFRDGGNQTTDKRGYALLIKELRDAITYSKEDFLLSVAVPATKDYIDGGFDVPEISKSADFLNLLTYDYHSAYEPEAKHHALLRTKDQLNVAWTINYYLSLGAPRNKLIVGMPLYGRSFTLSPDGKGAQGPGEEGIATREKGYLAYYEICQKVKDDDWEVETASGVTFAHRGDQWVGFDDEEMLISKARFIIDQGLGGAMIWTLDNDDFRGLCTDEPSPLVSSVRDVLFGSNLIAGSSRLSMARSAGGPLERSSDEPPPEEIPRRRNTLRRLVQNRQTARETASRRLNPSAEANSLDTTPNPPAAFECSDEGFFNNPHDCKKYFWCLDSGPANLGVVPHAFTCPSGLHFNSGSEACDYPENVVCPVNSVSSVSRTPKVRSRATEAPSASRTPNIRTRSTTEPPTTTTTKEPEAGGSNVAELLRLLQSIGGVERLQSILGAQDRTTEERLQEDVQATTTLRSRPQHSNTDEVKNFDFQYQTPSRTAVKPEVVYVEETLPEQPPERLPYRTPIRVQVGRVVRVQNGTTLNTEVPAADGRRRMLVRFRNGERVREEEVRGRAVGEDRRHSGSNLLPTRANPIGVPNTSTRKPTATTRVIQTTLPTTTTSEPEHYPTADEEYEYYEDEYEDDTTISTTATTTTARPITTKRSTTTKRPTTTARPMTTTQSTTRRKQTTSLTTPMTVVDDGPPVQVLSGNEMVCNRRGVFIHPQECSKFVLCAPVSRSQQQTLKARVLNCPANHIYHIDIGRCMKGDRNQC